MLRGIRSSPGLTPRYGVRHAIADVAVVGLFFGFHELVRGIAGARHAVAIAHGVAVMDVERRLGMLGELRFQRWALAHPTVLTLLDFTYITPHLVAPVAVAVWVIARHPDRFHEIRTVFILILAVAIPVYLIYPLAPPRLFPGLGFHDTLVAYSGVNYDQPAIALLYNPYAAMPSLHASFALFVSLSLVRVSGRRITWLGHLYGAAMGAATVATGNHFVLDVVAGMLLALGADRIVPRGAGARPVASI
ncbi:MAG TPA: phosphatase PAP2 family protein [Thermomicrobiaceae bacterium]|nr:phosphatase PAP2 family protein [Thermomicrobiaceae bacterium]